MGSRSAEADTELICHERCVLDSSCMRWTFHFRTKRCTFYQFKMEAKKPKSYWKPKYDYELYTTYHSEKELKRLRKREKLH